MEGGRLVVALVLGMVFALSGCASRVPRDYANFEQIHDYPSGGILRAFVKATPVLRDQAFYGNYGGAGDNGGPPVDRLDDLCRRHDVVYWEASAYKTLRKADRLFVREVKRIPVESLSPEGQIYRRRTVRYFESFLGTFLGKPVPSFFHWRETHPRFSDDARLEAFFLETLDGD